MEEYAVHDHHPEENIKSHSPEDIKDLADLKRCISREKGNEGATMVLRIPSLLVQQLAASTATDLPLPATSGVRKWSNASRGTAEASLLSKTSCSTEDLLTELHVPSWSGGAHLSTLLAALTTSDPKEFSFDKDLCLEASKEFELRFGVADTVTKVYGAALKDGILLQGKLYVGCNHIGFFSPFNSITVFGPQPSVVLFQYSAIKEIRKCNIALIFPNALEFHLVDGTIHFFASLINREKTLDYISIVRKIAIEMTAASECVSPTASSTAAGSGAPITVNVEFFVVPTDVGPYPPWNDACPQESAPPMKQLKHAYPVALWRCSITKVFALLFQDNSSTGFLTRLAENGGGLDVQLDSFYPSPPPPFGEGTIGVWPRRHTRYTRKIKRTRATAALGVPEFAETDEVMTVFVFSPQFVIIESVVSMSGIPFGDTFTARARYKLTSLSEQECQLDAEIALEWKKFCLFSSKIEADTVEGFGETVQFLKEEGTKVLNPSGASVELIAGSPTTAHPPGDIRASKPAQSDSAECYQWVVGSLKDLYQELKNMLKLFLPRSWLNWLLTGAIILIFFVGCGIRPWTTTQLTFTTNQIFGELIQLQHQVVGLRQLIEEIKSEIASKA